MSVPSDCPVLNDSAWERVMAATGGAAAACYQCGVCTAVCPWGLVRDEATSVRKLIRSAQLGLDCPGDELWLCTTCGACEAGCPKGVEVTEVLRGLRYLAWQDRRVPKGLPSLLWGLHADNNPWGRPPSERTGWARGLQVPEFGAECEILYYVGCTACYNPRMQKIARALVGIFHAAAVRFGTLGEREPCCGEAAHTLGQADYTREIVAANERLFAGAGVTTLVTISPHCYDMFRNKHFAGGPPAGWRPLHYSEYLAELIDAGRLRFDRPMPLRVTYHDPCYLGRRNGLYEAPRRVLQAIPGVELIEMEENRAEALCCGGGGGRMWQETAAGERFADLRIAQARATGAEVVATTCPHCVTCLEDSASANGAAPLRVADVSELAAASLGIPTGPVRHRSDVTSGGARDATPAMRGTDMRP